MKNKLIIACAILVTLAFVIPLSYAILRSAANATGQITPAEWSVELIDTGDNNHLSVISGDNNSSASYRVSITSTSEVDVIYSIVVDDLQDGINVTLDGTNTQPSDNDKVIFSEIGTINYTDQNKTKVHTLTFTADADSQAVIDKEVNINVIARQVLPN